MVQGAYYILGPLGRAVMCGDGERNLRREEEKNAKKRVVAAVA
jgi:hypothetical protein